MAQLPSKRERSVIRQFITNPHLITQKEVMQKLNLTERHDFYRVFTRCVIADRKDELDAQ